MDLFGWGLQALESAGPLALAFLFILWAVKQVFNGNIVPRKIHEDRIHDLQNENRWLREAINLQAKTNAEMIEATKTHIQLLRALRNRESDGGQ